MFHSGRLRFVPGVSLSQFIDGFGNRHLADAPTGGSPSPLGVLGKAALAKALEDIGKVFQVDAAAVVLDPDLHHRSSMFLLISIYLKLSSGKGSFEYICFQ